MANVLGIGGLSTSSGTTKLLAAYGNDVIDVDTGSGYGLNLSSTNSVVFESFLDSLFLQNFNHTPTTFDGSSWTNLHVKSAPIAKYMLQWRTTMYLAYIKLNSTTYASRVWKADLPTVDSSGQQTIQWGLQTGSNGSVVAGQKIFRSASSGFKTYGVKVGDPLIIENGANAGQYTITRISDDQRVDVLEEFKETQSSITFWCGSNWFDVKTNNSDVISGLADNNDRLLVFKQDTLHRYDNTTLRDVKGVPGTTSHRSIGSLRGATIYFHGSDSDRTGFYLYDGTTSVNISRKVQPYIDGLSTDNYTNVVHWIEGDEYRAYLGTLTNKNSSNDAYNISMSNAVFSYNVTSNAVSVDPIGDVVSASGKLRESSQNKWFIGTGDDEVHQVGSGYSFNGTPIRMVAETKVVYPRGNEIVNIFTRVRIVSRDAGRVSVSYKLWGDPFNVDQTWRGLGDLERDTVEIDIPIGHARASGIQIRFQEYGSKEPVPVIEKLTIYSYPETKDTPELSRLS